MNPPTRSPLRPLPPLLALLLAGACASAPRLVDSDPATGFAVYRSGRLSAAEQRALCASGVEEVAVLAGTAGRFECRRRSGPCADLAVVYDHEQRADVPLSADFLAGYDTWIEEARAAGRAVAFRCRHGWHRAGRLTAWYRMRHQGWSAEEAIDEMLAVGHFMWRHPYLAPQVRAMADHLAGRPCSTEPRHCVLPGEGEPVPFAAGACP